MLEQLHLLTGQETITEIVRFKQVVMERRVLLRQKERGVLERNRR